MCKLAIYCVNFGVDFIFKKFCLCKKNDKYQVCFKLGVRLVCMKTIYMSHTVLH